MNPDSSIFKNLIKIYGINKNTIFYICNFIGVNYNSLFEILNKKQIFELNNLLENNFVLGKFLKLKTKENIFNKINLNLYVGKRFKNNYPVRGQRTRTNAKTAKNRNKI